jgi:hypothetical protein
MLLRSAWTFRSTRTSLPVYRNLLPAKASTTYYWAYRTATRRLALHSRSRGLSSKAQATQVNVYTRPHSITSEWKTMRGEGVLHPLHLAGQWNGEYVIRDSHYGLTVLATAIRRAPRTVSTPAAYRLPMRAGMLCPDTAPADVIDGTDPRDWPAIPGQTWPSNASTRRRPSTPGPV